RVRVIEWSSVLAARDITETEECAQRIPWIGSGNARPPVVHVQAEYICARLEIQVGLEFMHGVVQPGSDGPGCSCTGKARNGCVCAEDTGTDRSPACPVVEIKHVKNVKTTIRIGRWIGSGQDQVCKRQIVRRVDVTIGQFDF